MDTQKYKKKIEQQRKTIERLQRTLEKRDTDVEWVIEYYENRLKEADKIAVYWRDKCDSIIRRCYKWLTQCREWKDYKDGYFSFHDKKCALCGSEEGVSIHHPKYEKGLLPWEYISSEVVPLCKKCHYKVHRDKNHPLHEKYEDGKPLPEPVTVMGAMIMSGAKNVNDERILTSALKTYEEKYAELRNKP